MDRSDCLLWDSPFFVGDGLPYEKERVYLSLHTLAG